MGIIEYMKRERKKIKEFYTATKSKRLSPMACGLLQQDYYIFSFKRQDNKLDIVAKGPRKGCKHFYD